MDQIIELGKHKNLIPAGLKQIAGVLGGILQIQEKKRVAKIVTLNPICYLELVSATVMSLPSSSVLTPERCASSLFISLDSSDRVVLGLLSKNLEGRKWEFPH